MRISLCSIFVADQQQALAFYTGVLGFLPKQDLPIGEFRWLTVVSPEEPEGTELVLEPNSNPAALAYQTALVEQGIPITAFAVDDVAAEHARLTARGVRFTMPPTEMPGVTLAVFEEGCGNLVQMYRAG